MQLLNDLAVFLANPPGNLVYILAVAFTLIGSLQGAIGQWRITGLPQARRLVIGLAVLIFIQLFIFIFSGLIQQNIIQGSLFLPVIDRSAILLSLVWIIWMWAFPDYARTGDVATILLSLLIFAATIFGSVFYVNENTGQGFFNVSSQAFYWDLGGIVILCMGIGLLLIRKPADWGSGLAVVFLPLLGFIFDIFLPAESGDYSGILRFFLLATYPILLSLPSRFFMISSKPLLPPIFDESVTVVENENQSLTLHESAGNSEIQDRRKFSTDQKTLQTLLVLAAETDSNKINQSIVRAVAHSLLVDLCFLIFINGDENSLFISIGYDLIREENLEGGIINRDAVPMLANAVNRGRPLRLQSNTASADIKGLGQLLGLANPGNLLSVPISSSTGTIGSILLLSPYSNRIWSADDQAYLVNISSLLYPIIERSRRSNDLDIDRERAVSSAKDAVEQSMKLNLANNELTAQVNLLMGQLAQTREEAAEQAELLAQSIQLESSKEEILTPIDNSEGGPSTRSSSQMENELRMTLVEMARLQNQLAQSNTRIIELESKGSSLSNSDQVEVIASISQELRQPMTSIIGYADLLLGESVGILGALQRKFIERIRTSTERIGSLVDDLIRINNLESGPVNFNTETVDLNLIIDNAMAYTASQMREKNIALRIDIPENLQPLNADREALQQILIHLLQNAGAASPVEGSVTLRVRTQVENAQEHVIIQVSDTGGGIPREDLPRVFSRLYRAENTLIQGVGDKGVGLSIAKTLTDAQHGRIWVDTDMGVGSTFSVSLPLRSETISSMTQGV